MALTLRGIPSLLLQPQHPGCERPPSSSGVVHLSRRCRKLPCIHCSAQTGESLSNEDGPPQQSWMQPDGARGDSYSGWSFLDSNSKRNKLSGFLKIGAGIALAVGLALVSQASSKKGGLGNLLPFAPAVHQETVSPAVEDSSKTSEQTSPTQEIEEENNLQLHDAAEHHADEKSANSPQPDTTTGQVSFPSEKVGDLSDEEIISSASATGAASTFDSKEHAGEELSRDESGGNGSVDFELGDEFSSPTDLTAKAISDDVNSSAPGAQAPESTHTSSGHDEKASSESSPENDPIPESMPTILNSNIPDSLNDGSMPSEEPLGFAISEVPVDDHHILVASLDFIGVIKSDEISETAPSVELKTDAPEEEFESMSLIVSNQKESSSPSEVGASPVENAADLLAPEADEINRTTSTIDMVSPSSESEFWHFTSVGIPAPSTPSAVASGRVLVPPVVDHAQEQALAVLQSLKVVEPGVEAGDICTRRDYARWLVAANRALARSSAAKVLPAMYIENATELAFDDVSPDDPDFPFIQGLAEAGLISSNLSQDVSNGDNVKFLPDSPLSRQDLVSWKLALEQRSLPSVDHNKLQDKTGFIDIEQINKDAWPAIAADISAGERSIIASSFGYTRRFQPQKPVTIAQAAIALVSGEASEQVSEDLDRLEAEKLAEKAVAAEIALEARAQKEVNALFHEELESQKQMAAAAEALAQDLRAELERVKAEREEEKFGLLKERATVDAAKESLSQTRAELDGLMQEVSFEKVKVVYERERLEKLIAEIEEERETLLKLKSDVEVEMRALALARTWAEDEAKKARAHAKVLEEARKRWEAQGIEVHVDKELDDVNIPVPSWQFNGDKFELEKPLQKDPMHNIFVKADEYKGKSLKFFKEGLHLSGDKLSSLQQKVLSSLHEIKVRVQDVQKSTFFHVTRKASEVQGAAASMASGLSSLVSENTHKFADGCRGSAEKLAQIFKN